MRFAALALALLAAPAFAQDGPLRPGDLDFSDLQPYTFEFDVYLTAPMQQKFGTATETFTIDGNTALSTTSVSGMINGQFIEQSDSISVEWPTFAPVRHVTVANGSVESYDFSPDAVSGVTRSGGAVDATFEAPVFGPGTADVVARTMMLEEGATAQFAAFDDDSPDTPATVRLTTTGQQEVLGRTAWIITADDGGDVTTYAIDAASGETLRVAFSPQPGVVIELRRSDLETDE